MAYTTIKDPSAYFQTALYTGNAGTLTITNDGNSNLQPDWIWLKRRDGAASHNSYDSSRGTGKHLAPDITYQEITYHGVTAFNSDGFTLSSGGDMNYNGATNVAWQWKANGGTTTSVSASGTGSGCVNACTYQANTTAGFSIITYTGRDDQLNNGQHSILKHGLGVAPTFIILKRRDSAADWYVMGKYVTSASAYSNNEYLSLNDTDAINGNSYVGSVAPTSTDIYLGNQLVNVASATYVMYAFADVQGYSKFGSYVGNGNQNGPFVYTGFKPAFIMVKSTSATGSWRIWDSARNPFNLADNTVHADRNTAENAHGSDEADILSNGFKARNTGTWHNASGVSYIYMAFAENPFVAGGVPTTAR